ncbi:MAG: phosphatidate cytidylyltransferase [Acidimicrobiia bacterium]
MSERETENENEDIFASPPAPAGEGVRIIGADEAQAVMASGRAAERITPDEPITPAVVSTPVSTGATRSTLFDDTSEMQAVEAIVTEEPTGVVPLPHWTEPPTGEVPIAVDADLEPIDTDATGALRFHIDDAGGWHDEELHEALTSGDDAEVRTAATPFVEDAPDRDDDFDEAVAARRTRRTASTPSVRGVRRTGPGALPDGPISTAVGPRGVLAGTPGAPSGAGSGMTMPGAAFQTSKAPANLVLRVGVGIAVGGIAIVFFLLGPAWTTGLVAVLAGLVAIELYGAFQKQHAHPATLLGIIACAAMPIAAYNVGDRAFPVMGAVVLVFTLLWYLFKVGNGRPVVGVAMTLFGFGYVGILAGFAGLLLRRPSGVGALVGIAACAVAYDTAGYLIGSMMGKTRITPHISPNKTLEGLIAGMLASVVVGVFMGILHAGPWDGIGAGLGIGVLCAFMAPLGDLCESMLKRDLGVKDFGDLLPGHGGALDRFDTILFCLPAGLFLLTYLFG